MKLRFLLIPALLAASTAQASHTQAATLVRNARPADALDSLAGQDSAEASFWRGRALIDLNRLREAAESLEKVPLDHELYPYAAKALLYCAWKSESVDFAVVATPMATSSHPEIATLATAALAEFWLRQPRSYDNSALERLRRMAADKPELQPLLRLLEIDNHRLRGEFDKAIELCRQMEADTSLPTIMRQRARLSLSSVYYAKEDTQPQVGESPPPESEFTLLGDAPSAAPSNYDDGKGEETLLHFISAHPESPLLEEAFRRLLLRNAFVKSEYARSKLREWAEEPLKSRRAATALLILQHQLVPENASIEIPIDVTCANTAAATCPNEPATRTILLEQTRWFLNRQQTREALLYLGMIRSQDIVKDFLEIQLRDPRQPSTAQAYLQCARQAPGNLRPVALENALISALISGDTAVQETVLNMPDISPEQHFALLSTRVAYLLDKNPDQAQQDLSLLLSSPAPTLDLRADIEMDQAYLQMQRDPSVVRELLHRSSINDKLTELSEERLLRFFALQEEALRRISGTSGELNAGKESIELIRQAAGKVRSPHVVAVLTLHLASLQAAEGQYPEALRTLNLLLRKFPRTDFAPRALYMAGRVSELIGTQDSLLRAIELYDTCATRSQELSIKATTRRAAVLLRLGKHEESEQSLTHLLRTHPDMRIQDKLLVNAVLANNKALLGTAEGRSEAIRIAGSLLDSPELPTWWRFRALLHHANLCTRDGQHEQALKDYQDILDLHPASGKSPSQAEWAILYNAASGAVSQLVELKRYNEAAQLADSIAEWNKEEASLAKRRQFSDWAKFIRQTYFIN